MNTPVHNSGTVDVQSGTLRFSAGMSPAPSSSLKFTITGVTNYGVVVVDGNFQLAAALNVSVTNGFNPSVGNTFRIINWGSKQGEFSAANGFDLGNGLYFQGIADRSGLSLVTKTTIVPTPPPPTNLVNQTVAFGDTAVFAFSPPGVEPFTYQWTFSGTNLPGQTNPNLILTNVQLASLGTYCAVVADAFNITNTYCAVLSATNAPGISGQPAGQTVSIGANVTLTATANGAAPLRYQWRLNGENVPGATNSTYTITNAQPRDGGTYSVLVANQVRVIASSNAKVKVNTNALAFADSFAARGTITGSSGAGSGTNLTATHETGEPDHGGKPGTHSLWLQWTAPAGGVATFSTRGSSFDTLLGVYTGTSVTNLTSVAGDDDRGAYFTSEAVFNAAAGTNYLIAVDGLGNASGDIVLAWSLDTNITLIPKIVQHPANVTVAAGGVAPFSVFAASATNLTYQWYLGNWLAIPGATNSTLVLSNVTYLNVGTYSVEVTSANGQTVASLPASLEIGPSADAQSFDKLEDLLAGVASGNNFANSILARSDREEAGAGKGGRGKGRGKGGDGGGITAQSVSFPSVSVGTIGSQIINNFNSTTEQGEPIHSDVIGGASRWYLLTAETNGTMVVDTLGSDIDTVISVYTGEDIFTLQLVAKDNNGASDGVRSLVRFRVTPQTDYLIAVDGVNRAQGNINLNWRMGIPPNATGPAQNLVVTGGANVLLQAGVSNNVTAPTYQWRRNGVSLTGATNATYTISSLRYDQVGSYSVLVSNLVGQVLNAIATVSADTALRLSADPGGFIVTGSAPEATVLELSTDLALWTPLYTNTTPLLPVSYLDTNAPARPEGFYRLQPWP